MSLLIYAYETRRRRTSVGFSREKSALSSPSWKTDDNIVIVTIVRDSHFSASFPSIPSPTNKSFSHTRPIDYRLSRKKLDAETFTTVFFPSVKIPHLARFRCEHRFVIIVRFSSRENGGKMRRIPLNDINEVAGTL